MAEAAPNHTGEPPPPVPPPPARAGPPQPALAHVYGVEDPFRELLQLVRGVLGLLLQPQVVLPEVLDFRLQVGFVFLFLGGRAEEERAGTQQLEGWLGTCVSPSPTSVLHPNTVSPAWPWGSRYSKPGIRTPRGSLQFILEREDITVYLNVFSEGGLKFWTVVWF